VRIIIAHNYTSSSFSVISWSLSRHLVMQGHEVLFFSHQPTPDSKTETLPGLTVVGWPEKRPTGIRSFRYYYRLHKAFKPQLVILHFAPQYVAAIASWLLGCPHRWAYYHTAEEANIVDMTQNLFVNKLRRIRRNLLYRLFTRIICVSQFAKKDIQRYFKVPAKKIEVVYNALPDRWKNHFSNAGRDTVYFHLLGRLDHCKRVLELTDAFIAFKKETGLAAQLCIAGSGPMEHELKIKIEGRPDIHYKGVIPYEEVDAFIGKAHYLVCSSLVETFGMVNAESIMNAIPVIANRVGGIPEIVVDGKTGFLSQGMERDHWIALFEKAWVFVKEQPSAYFQMQEDCRAMYLEHFTIEKYIAIMESKIMQLQT
jgi:glycosyltransferase involved in cell wall biosynthesis